MCGALGLGVLCSRCCGGTCIGWLQVPVGRETLGRIINVIGEPVDERGPLSE